MPSLVSLRMTNAYGGKSFRFIDMMYVKEVDAHGRSSLRFMTATYEEKLAQQFTKHLIEELGTDAIYPERGVSYKRALASRMPEIELRSAVSSAASTFMSMQGEWAATRGGLDPRERLQAVDNVMVVQDALNPLRYNIVVIGTTLAGSNFRTGSIVGLRQQ